MHDKRLEEELRRLWTAGVSQREIWGKLGLSKWQLWRLSQRLKLPKRGMYHVVAKTDWPPARNERLRQLVEDWPELSCRELGARMGVSKNAVIGKLRRLGISKPKPPPKPVLKPVKRTENKARVTVGRHKSKLKHPAPAIAIAKPLTWQEPTPPPAGTHAIDFIQARVGQCQYPLWPQTERIGKVCGNPAIKGQPYCPECMKRVLRRVA